MARDRTLVLLLAGGAGSRLDPLTDGRAKPAVPFAGTVRLIDFPLSNCLHAGLSDVWVIQQHCSPGWSPGATPSSTGYWRDVGTIDAYFSAHQDLLGPSPRLDLELGPED